MDNSNFSLQKLRLNFQPQLPRSLQKIQALATVAQKTPTHSDQSIQKLFPQTFSQPILHFEMKQKQTNQPLRVGVVFSGGQAAGGHNVISGLFDALKKLNPESALFGFLNGPIGIINNNYIELTETLINQYRNQGGFDLIGSGRTKIEKPEQFAAAEQTMKTLKLDGLVIIGGDDSNTNAAFLAEYFTQKKVPTRVIGAPKTIDGDLKNDFIEMPFGFDTATKTYSNIIGNVERDALSAKKYYFFIKLMGRTASHITLECALQTHPNYALISEEIAADNKTLTDIVQDLSDLIAARSKLGKDYGVVLVPEGLLEFISECKVLIDELNTLLSPEKPHANIIEALTTSEQQISYVKNQLTEPSQKCYNTLPKDIQIQLLLDRDPHGNVQVSKIDTEKLLIEMVKNELKERKEKGTYQGKFTAQGLFCGYEGRSCYPSNFDAQYCYALGHTVAALLHANVTGYMACIKNLSLPVEQWEPLGIPLTSLMAIEERHGQPKAVIKKALVDLNGTLFTHFKKHRNQWASGDLYRYPGPIQYFGPKELTDRITFTLEKKGKSAKSCD